MQDMTAYQRAQNCIAQGALTNSKHPDNHVLGVYPTHLSSRPGLGAYVYDTSNQQYTDYICGLGTNLLGYGNGYISEAVRSVINYGASHSLPTLYEIEAAEALKQMFFFIDKWKFLKTGTEACMAAIKIARAYTGREIVLSEGYHGWSDEFVGLTSPAKGCHESNSMFNLSERDQFDPKEIAAIIIEPVITDWSPARRETLKGLRDFCDKNGVVLIYDEVITGFRFEKFCVSLASNILPDLLVIGKAMANGFPLAAVGGKAALMDGDYFVSSTYAGDVVSLAACSAVVKQLMTNMHYNVDRLWEAGKSFIERFNEIGQGRLRLEAYPSRGVFVGSDLDIALLRQSACLAGILLHKTWFYNFPLMREDFMFFNFFEEFMRNLKLGRISLKGKMPKVPFAQGVRDARKN